MKFLNLFSRKAKPTAVALPTDKQEQGVLDLSAKAGFGEEVPTLGTDLQSVLARSIQRSITDIPTIDSSLIFTGDAAAEAVKKTKVGDAFSGTQDLSVGSISPALTGWYASQGFIGHQLCAIIAQHWLVGKACAMPAEDALRNGWTTDFKGVEDANQVEELTETLSTLDSKFNLDKVLLEAAKFTNVFGIRILIPLVDSTDPEYYKKKFNADGITPGSFRGWTQIDPQWIFPLLDSVGASDPSSPEFYEPTFWVAGGVTYHRSHLVIFKTEEPADILKPSYLFSGIPLTQRIAERVYAAERTANEAPLLAMSKRTTVLKVDLAKAKMKLSAFLGRIQQWVNYRDNYQVKVIGNSEDMTQTDTSLADLDVVIMTQYQLVAAIARVPATKLLGTSPKGFNATGEHEMKSYHEYLESIQSTWFDRFLERHYLLVSLSCLDGIEITHTWEPVDSVGAEVAANIQKIKAETAAIYLDQGVISPDEDRSRLRMDKESDYNLPEDVVAPGVPEEPAPGAEQPGAEPTVGDVEELQPGETILDDIVLATALVVAEPAVEVGPSVSAEKVSETLAQLAGALSKVQLKPQTTVVMGVTPTVKSIEPSVVPVPPVKFARKEAPAE